MDQFKIAFPKLAVFIVIHAVNPAQALGNAKIAFQNGADGVFLINHEISPKALLKCYERVRREFRRKFIGLNFLGVDLLAVPNSIPHDAQAIWLDDIGIEESGVASLETVQFTQNLPRSGGAPPLVFGGVAFKYQKGVRDLAFAARSAARHADVVTTSGDATGSPPTLEKLREIREAIPNRPLANASGITPENIREYKPYVDAVLVASGVSRSFTELDPARVALLTKNART